LADSLPQQALQAFLFERNDILATARQMKRHLSLTERSRLRELFSQHIEKHLDVGAGRCQLARPAIARLVADNPTKAGLKNWPWVEVCDQP
jgi:hypothetical protein